MGNEIAQNWMFLKIRWMADPKTEWIAGGARPPERNGTQEQCQSQEGIIWAGSFIFQPQVLKSQQGVKPAVEAVSHGNGTMCVCTCTFRSPATLPSWPSSSLTAIAPCPRRRGSSTSATCSTWGSSRRCGTRSSTRPCRGRGRPCCRGEGTITQHIFDLCSRINQLETPTKIRSMPAISTN